MANLFIPYTDMNPLSEAESTTIEAVAKNLIASNKDTIKTCAENSNIPPELLAAFLTTIGNGVNNSPFKKTDGLVRQGVACLSQKTAKIILCLEKARKGMNDAEVAFLSNADPAIGAYLDDTDKQHLRGNEYDWRSDFNRGVDRISENRNPFNLMNTNVSIQIAAIWIGQLWDYFATQTNVIVDKVLITALLPYNGWNAGNNFVKTKNWNTDFTKGANYNSLPKPANAEAPSNIVNPNGGFVGYAIRGILAQNGILDLYKKGRL